MKNCIGILVLFKVLAIIENSDSCGPKHIHCHNGKWFQLCFSLNNKTIFTGEKLRCGCNLICDENIGSFACISKETYDAGRTTSTSSTPNSLISISTTSIGLTSINNKNNGSNDFTTTNVVAESNLTTVLNTQFSTDATNHGTFNKTTKEPIFSTVTVIATASNTFPVITTEPASTIITNSFSADTKTTETNVIQSTRVTQISTDDTTVQPITASGNSSTSDQNDVLFSTELTSLTIPTTQPITDSTNSVIISTVPTIFTEYLTEVTSASDKTASEEMDTIETDVSLPMRNSTYAIAHNTTMIERDTVEFSTKSTVNVVTTDATISKTEFTDTESLTEIITSTITTNENSTTTITFAAPAAATSTAATTNNTTTTTTGNTITSSTTTTTIATTVSEPDCNSVGKGYYPASKCYQYYECYQIFFFWFSSLKTCSSGYAFNSTSETCTVNSLCIQ